MRNQKVLLSLFLGFIFLIIPNLCSAEPIRVAILDSGSNIDFKEGINFVDSTLKDLNGHGTLIAEIIKEACPRAELYIVKVIGRNGLVIHDDAVILGIDWAISKNVKVINMSLRMKPSPKLREVIQKAHDRGIILVSAAGNNDRYSDSYYSVLESKTFSNSSGFPSSDVAYPARYPEVIAVGALDRYGHVYDESVQSGRVDIYFKGYRGKKAGTSVASAYVAGTIAHVLSSPSGFNDSKKSLVQRQQMLELLSVVRHRCPAKTLAISPSQKISGVSPGISFPVGTPHAARSFPGNVRDNAAAVSAYKAAETRRFSAVVDNQKDGTAVRLPARQEKQWGSIDASEKSSVHKSPQETSQKPSEKPKILAQVVDDSATSKTEVFLLPTESLSERFGILNDTLADRLNVPFSPLETCQPKLSLTLWYLFSQTIVATHLYKENRSLYSLL